MNHQLYMNTKDFQPLAERKYQYVLAENGLFLLKENDVFTASVQVNPGEFGLLPIEETLKLKSHIKIPFIEIFPVVQFFRWVYDKHKTEAFLFITLDPKESKIGFFCPKQINGNASVHVDDDSDCPEQLLKIGTIHSHPCDAFHSEGDKDDEKYSDGLHIVCGNLRQLVPTFVVSLVVMGHRQRLNPEDVIEWQFDFNKDWIKKLSRQ
jgi:hypothetical protein